jgi:hypothetical protein
MKRSYIQISQSTTREEEQEQEILNIINIIKRIEKEYFILLNDENNNLSI